MARRAVVRLGIPALIVATLAIVAMWRVGPPPKEGASTVGTGRLGRGESADRADRDGRRAAVEQRGRPRGIARARHDPRARWAIATSGSDQATSGLSSWCSILT